ncbi:MAG: hypothetical protein ACE5KA_08285 [Nitrososphaerales archaeon]
MMSILMDTTAFVSAANVVVLIALLILYWRTYSSSKAQFTFGLILFASFLLMQNVIGVYSYIAMAPFFTESILPYMLTINIAEFIGLSALLKVTF